MMGWEVEAFITRLIRRGWKQTASGCILEAISHLRRARRFRAIGDALREDNTENCEAENRTPAQHPLPAE